MALEGQETEKTGTLLKVIKVHSQMIFAAKGDYELATQGFTLINFIEAVDGMGLYCSDLTDYVKPGDILMASEIVHENGANFAKFVVFDFDCEQRGFDDPATSAYHTGLGTVEYVDDYYARIRANDPFAPDFKYLAVPLTALTKDTIPVGVDLSMVKMKDLISVGDKLIYKVPKIPIDKGYGGLFSVASAKPFRQAGLL